MKTRISYVLALLSVSCGGLSKQIRESREKALGADAVAVYGEKTDKRNDYTALITELKADDATCREDSGETTNWITCSAASEEHLRGIPALKGPDDRIWLVSQDAALGEFLAKVKSARDLEQRRKFREAAAELGKIPGVDKPGYYANYLAHLNDKALQPEKDLNTVLSAIENPGKSDLDDTTAAELVRSAFESQPELSSDAKLKARYQAIVARLRGSAHCSLSITEPPGEIYISTGYPVPALAKAACGGTNLGVHFAVRIAAADKVRFGSAEISTIKPVFAETRAEIPVSELSTKREENGIRFSAEPRFAETFRALLPLGAQPALSFTVTPAEYTLRKVPVYFSADYERLAQGATPSAPWRTLRGKETEATVGMNGQFTMGGTRNGEPYDMVFGHPNGKYSDGIWSSYLTLNVNGNLYRFDKLPQQKRGESDDHKTLRIEADIPPENVSVVVTMQAAEKENYDLGIEVKNNSGETKKIGMRYLIDTWAGKTDGVPFITPAAAGELTLHTKEFKFTPVYSTIWETVDAGGDGYVYLRNTLNGPGLVAPDQLAFVQWGSAYRSEWDYPVSAEKTILGDSAALLWWQPRPVENGGTRRVATRFGVFQRKEKTFVDVQDAKSGFGYVYIERENPTAQPKKIRLEVESPDAELQLPAGKTQEFNLAPKQRLVRAIPVSVAGNGKKTVTIKEYEDGATTPRVSTLHFELSVDNGHSANVPVWMNTRPYPVRFVANKPDRKLRCRVKAADGLRVIGEGNLNLMRGDATKGEHIYGADIPLPADYRGETIVDIFDR